MSKCQHVCLPSFISRIQHYLINYKFTVLETIMMPQFDKETTAEQVCDAFSPRIKGRTFLITGTSARGLGAKIATTLASYSPARLILLARDKAKVDPVIEEIRSLDPDVDTRLVLCELSSQDSVRRAAGDILGDASIDKIDVVINNAAVMAVKEYTVDDRGNELQLSSNYSMLFLFLQNHDPPPLFIFCVRLHGAFFRSFVCM